MKDDSLSDVVHYCSMCDSLVEESHECGGFPFAKEQPDSVGMNRLDAKMPDGHYGHNNLDTDREIKIWNAAIEAAAKVVDDCNREGPYNAIGGAKRIRMLKK